MIRETRISFLQSCRRSRREFHLTFHELLSLCLSVCLSVSPASLRCSGSSATPDGGLVFPPRDPASSLPLMPLLQLQAQSVIVLYSLEDYTRSQESREKRIKDSRMQIRTHVVHSLSLPLPLSLPLSPSLP